MDRAFATRVLDHAIDVGPRCGSVVVVAIGGRSGAGKSTLTKLLAELVAERGLSCAIVHLDEMCPGWDGLSEVPARMHATLSRLAATRSATYPTWDWSANGPGPDRLIPPCEVLLVDGVTALDAASARYRSTSVWIEADSELRRTRAIARDGETFARQWAHWAQAEADYYASQPERHMDFTLVTG